MYDPNALLDFVIVSILKICISDHSLVMVVVGTLTHSRASAQ